MPHVSSTPNRRGALRREQILQAAEELFGTDGFGATSLRALAKRVGVTHAGILRHFPSKEDVLRALLDRLTEDLMPDASHPEADGAQRALQEAARRSTRPRVELYTTLLGEAVPPEHPAHGFVHRHLRTGRERLGRAFADHGVDTLALWDGLQVLSLYLPERVSPADILAARPLRQSGRAGESETTAWIAAAVGSARGEARSPARSAATVPADRSDEIIEAAARAFARQGFQGTSLRKLAGELKLTHGTLLYYFDSKEALLEAVLNRRDRQADTAYITPVTAYDKVYNVYRRALHNEGHPESVALYSAMLCEATDPAHSAHTFFATRYTRILDTLATEIASLQQQGFLHPQLDPETEAALLTALWDGLQLHARYLGDTSIPERLLRHLDDLIVDSVPSDRRSDLLTRAPAS
ncbi:TetR/AcrR family transcriptional regulator [Streptomyces sp. NPDC058855]|uniref:TetR/AcrR family transcriptional regulator n=1 Tax=Streptomyces sp. NPDC058855 TaxID=3346651 RepID=UPI0036CBA782